MTAKKSSNVFVLLFEHIFIDGLSGMAFGLFSTLIIGTIICQIGSLIGDNSISSYLIAMGNIAKTPPLKLATSTKIQRLFWNLQNRIDK